MRQLKITNIVWGIVLLVLVILSIHYAYISADAPYYLSISRDISNGIIPFKDVKSIYAPLMMYLNSIIFKIFDNPEYHYFLLFQYFIILVSATFLYLICKKLNVNFWRSIFISLFLFITVLSSDGNYINLEVYIMMFVFISFWLLINKNYFWTGVFLALGFFSKQYGILNFLPFLFLVLIYHKYHYKNLINFLFGALVPLLLFLVYFVLIEDVSFISLLEQLSGKGYVSGEAYAQTSMASAKSLFSILAGSKVFILLLIPLFFLKIKPLKNKIDAVLILGIAVNLIPAFIQNFQHYFILTYPYIFILMARNYKNFDKRFLLVLNIMLVIISVLLFLRIFRYKDVYDEQLRVSEKFKVEYPIGSKVFLSGGIRYLYILNDYHNPALDQMGYAYDFYPDEDFKKEYDVLSLE